jgi:hypothetical protein
MTYLVTWKNKECNLKYSGTVSFSEFIDAVISIHSDTNYSTLKCVIHDLSSASQLTFYDTDMTELAAHALGARYTNSDVRVVMVTSDEIAIEKITEFMLLTGIDIHICDSQKHALSYVNS